MTPKEIILIIKDGCILAAVLFIGWFVWNSGKNTVKVGELKALQRAVQSNAAQERNWQEVYTNADKQRQLELASIRSDIANRRSPVYVMRYSSGPRLSGDSGKTRPNGADSSSRRANWGSGSNSVRVDIRPSLAEFERKYETALADYRNCMNKWPVVSK